MKVKTRTLYKLVGSDYSAQEPRLTAHMADEIAMKQAYVEGKDLYCVIASKIYNNDYWDNTEFYKEFQEVLVGDNLAIAGSDKVFELSIDEENSIVVPWCYLVTTDKGEIVAEHIKPGDNIKSKDGFERVASVREAATTNVNGCVVKNIKIIFVPSGK